MLEIYPAKGVDSEMRVTAPRLIDELDRCFRLN